MSEKYEIELLGQRLSIENPKLIHQLVETFRLPVEVVARLAASSVNVLGLPIVAAERYGQRLLWLIDRANEQVPADRRIQPPPSVAGPILEQVKYLEDENPLLAMYANLLARTFDRDRVNEAHPAFPSILTQLSPDEALVLYRVSKEPRKRIEHYDYYPYRTPAQQNYRLDGASTWPGDGLVFPQHEKIYLGRLVQLNLIGISPQTETPAIENAVDRSYVSTITTKVSLSDFGRLFASACFPERWDFPLST